MGLSLWMLGFDHNHLTTDMNSLLALLFHQGVLDEQFLELQDESSPNFVNEVVSLYFHESDKSLMNLRGLVMEREFWDKNKVGVPLYGLMGSSASIGAKRVRNACLAFQAASDHNNRAGCLHALELIEQEYCTLKNKLTELFQVVNLSCSGVDRDETVLWLAYTTSVHSGSTQFDFSRLPMATLTWCFKY